MGFPLAERKKFPGLGDTGLEYGSVKNSGVAEIGLPSGL